MNRFSTVRRVTPRIEATVTTTKTSITIGARVLTTRARRPLTHAVTSRLASGAGPTGHGTTRAGNSTNVSSKAKATAQTIISPKSMTGRISANIIEAKATMVVSAVNNDGLNLLASVSSISARADASGALTCSSRCRTTRCTISDRVRINTSEMKFDDTTVTGQPMKPRNPTMPATTPAQIRLGTTTQRRR